ncbi:NAD-binding protein [Schizopora paradoxa]|uniref:D-xylose 1-dehydrogenase (NADP(+), D-xylono-1,5-lactone-forming) n=1 Tax=Schizopora paradoxa TaxID=27342 RepID=A0A0H2S5A5_9AGAM|nr:NAD-binding protein [Schizopora paradoxa]
MFEFIGRLSKAFNPTPVPKSDGVLRCGILGAAKIAPLAVIIPTKSHSEFIISAVAARSKDKAEAFAKKHGIEKVYSGATGYQDLLDDKDIDVIYNPLPNGLHYEWTLKALAAGKHVLLEKPSTNTEEEARILFEYADKKGLVLLEAAHSRFHPAFIRVKEIIDSGELGKLKNVKSTLCVPRMMVGEGKNDNDIRYQLELGGGIMMDMGCYTLMAVRTTIGAEPLSVISASATPIAFGTEEQRKTIDIGTEAALAFPSDVTAEIQCHSRWPGWGPFGLLPRYPDVKLEATCEGGKITLDNFVVPTLYHKIQVVPINGKKRTEWAYTFKDGTGEDWWLTYRYQLEAFVDKIKGRQPKTWITGEESIGNMKWIEEIYKATGFGVRPKSSFVLSEADVASTA